MRELEHLLPELTPPPGGLARLQRSLRAQREPTHRHLSHWLPALAGAGAMALLALVWLADLLSHQHAASTLTQALQQAATTTPLPNGIHVEHGAALLLPSGQANARVYLIASTPPTPH